MKNNVPPQFRTKLDKCVSCGKNGIKMFWNEEHKFYFWKCKFCKFIRYESNVEMDATFTNAKGDFI